MSNRFSRYLKSGIIGIWLILIVLLVYRHYISGADYSLLQSISGSQFRTSEEWFGVYVQNKKIGYVKTASEKIGNEYRFTRAGVTGMPGAKKSGKSSTDFKCLTDLNYRIRSFDFEARTDGRYYKSHGELDKDNVLLVFMETGGKKRAKTQKIKGQTFLPVTIRQMLFARGLEKGARFSVPVLNVFTLQVEDTVVEVLDLIPVKVGINVNTAYLLKIGSSYSWISDRGGTLKEEHPGGVSYFAETEDAARSGDMQYIFDFLSIPVLESNKLLKAQEDLSSIKIRLSGVEFKNYPLLHEGRQTLTGDVLEITKDKEGDLEAGAYALPYKGKDLGPFLAPSRFVQSDHHTIIYNAKKFAAIEKNAFRLARFLTSNLYLTILKAPQLQLHTAMEIFNSHAGESNEHTVMFTSFARAGGLPARMVGGLVYRKGHFYYHSWPEVWLGSWVPVDPTLGQFPADVTHIRFVQGDIDEIAAFGNIIKDIKVEILEAS